MMEPTTDGWPDYVALRHREGIPALLREIREIRAARRAAAEATDLELEANGHTPEYYKRRKREGQLSYMLHLAQSSAGA